MLQHLMKPILSFIFSIEAYDLYQCLIAKRHITHSIISTQYVHAGNQLQLGITILL